MDGSGPYPAIIRTPNLAIIWHSVLEIYTVIKTQTLCNVSDRQTPDRRQTKASLNASIISYAPAERGQSVGIAELAAVLTWNEYFRIIP